MLIFHSLKTAIVMSYRPAKGFGKVPNLLRL